MIPVVLTGNRKIDVNSWFSTYVNGYVDINAGRESMRWAWMYYYDRKQAKTQMELYQNDTESHLDGRPLAKSETIWA